MSADGPVPIIECSTCRQWALHCAGDMQPAYVFGGWHHPSHADDLIHEHRARLAGASGTQCRRDCAIDDDGRTPRFSQSNATHNLLLLVVDDDISYGGSVTGSRLDMCLVWRVDCATAEILLTTYVPALIVGGTYSPSNAALRRLARCARPDGAKPSLILTSVPSWAVEPLIRGFANQAARATSTPNRAWTIQ